MSSHLTTKLYKLSAPLQGLLGKTELSRPAAIKELYVRLRVLLCSCWADGGRADDLFMWLLTPAGCT